MKKTIPSSPSCLQASEIGPPPSGNLSFLHETALCPDPTVFEKSHYLFLLPLEKGITEVEKRILVVCPLVKGAPKSRDHLHHRSYGFPGISQSLLS